MKKLLTWLNEPLMNEPIIERSNYIEDTGDDINMVLILAAVAVLLSAVLNWPRNSYPEPVISSISKQPSTYIHTTQSIKVYKTYKERLEAQAKRDSGVCKLLATQITY